MKVPKKWNSVLFLKFVLWHCTHDHKTVLKIARPLSKEMRRWCDENFHVTNVYFNVFGTRYKPLSFLNRIVLPGRSWTNYYVQRHHSRLLLTTFSIPSYVNVKDVGISCVIKKTTRDARCMNVDYVEIAVNSMRF